jgi:hypothetical protein
MTSAPELVQTLIREIYAAFNARQMEAVLSRFASDVDWPNGMEGGRVHGREAVRDYWTRQWAVMNPHVEPQHMEEDAAGHTVVKVHQVVRDLEGKLLVDQIVHHVYTIRNGLIERMDIQNDE